MPWFGLTFCYNRGVDNASEARTMNWKQVENEGDRLIAAITNRSNEDLSENERADADAEADRILDYFPSEHLAELQQYVEQYSNVQINWHLL